MIIKEGTYGNKTLGYYKSKFFFRVFWHNHTTSPCFNSETEALSCDLPGKYSILSDLSSDIYNIDGFRYFIIRYPSISNYGIYFRQRNNPLDETETGKNNSIDFNFIFSDSRNNYNLSGLTRSGLSYSLLEGQPRLPNWYYSIGLFCNPYSDFVNIGIPAGINNKEVANYVELWAQINMSFHIKDYTICYYSYASYLNFVLLSLSIFVYIPMS